MKRRKIYGTVLFFLGCAGLLIDVLMIMYDMGKPIENNTLILKTDYLETCFILSLMFIFWGLMLNISLKNNKQSMTMINDEKKSEIKSSCKGSQLEWNKWEKTADIELNLECGKTFSGELADLQDTKKENGSKCSGSEIALEQHVTVPEITISQSGTYLVYRSAEMYDNKISSVFDDCECSQENASPKPCEISEISQKSIICAENDQITENSEYSSDSWRYREFRPNEDEKNVKIVNTMGKHTI